MNREAPVNFLKAKRNKASRRHYCKIAHNLLENKETRHPRYTSLTIQFTHWGKATLICLAVSLSCCGSFSRFLVKEKWALFKQHLERCSLLWGSEASGNAAHDEVGKTGELLCSVLMFPFLLYFIYTNTWKFRRWASGTVIVEVELRISKRGGCKFCMKIESRGFKAEGQD